MEKACEVTCIDGRQKAGEVYTGPASFQGSGRGPSSFINIGEDRVKDRNRKMTSVQVTGNV